MPKLTPKEFVAKWSQIRLKEITTAQSHFNDVCALVDHKTPLDADPKGEFFTFEAVTEKTGGKKGRADVWYKGKFIWEYKGTHADLDKAYQQLLLYREALGNPSLLITSDTQQIIIHTNFTNTVKKIYVIDFNSLLKGDGLDLLKRAFYDPQSFKPPQTQEQVTKATADTFVAVADTLKKWAQAEGQSYDPERTAHFIIRLLFCLFAEDMGLLPDDLFTKLVGYRERGARDFMASLRGLFAVMREGGVFGIYPIPNFDGGLFDDDYVPELPGDIIAALLKACGQDWSSIDPSIFGTLFERVIDESKRAQLGAHYTSKDDIMLIVEPVLMQPLRTQWQEVKHKSTGYMKKDQTDKAYNVLKNFSDEIAATRVLDPACGSGNFLYMALRQLLDLQKEVIVFAGRQGLPDIPLAVSPAQLYGIEIDSYAHELAQITVWIGYIQWRFENGFSEIQEPILQSLKNIEHKDSILAYDAEKKLVEPEWPEADVAIGNPPFLGSQKMRSGLKDKYVGDLRSLYADRLPGQSDLVCYWFEKARAMIAAKRLRRAGLLATQGIRGGANRTVLERIKNTGNIFWAQSDRNWILEGATVHVSMVGFDDGTEKECFLDGKMVPQINPDLSSSIDLTKASQLPENIGFAFQGPVKIGPFEIEQSTAKKMLTFTNESGRSNADVVRPWINGFDITHRPRGMYIIDFNEMRIEEAALYEKPFEHVKTVVKPIRDDNRRKRRREYWWLHGETVPSLRRAIDAIPRYIVTPRVAKYRLFIWMDNNVLPDSATIAIARDDDYLFGVLHSKVHELWARRLGTQLREAESGFRYTPSSTFETFPFPWPPRQEPSEEENEHVAAIAEAARDLVEFRDSWLNPEGVGITISELVVKKRTLTNLYNALTHYRENVKGKHRSPDQWKQDVDGIIDLDEIEELDHIHTTLDHAVLDAYGWPHSLTDEQILEHLLALNLKRAAAEAKE